MEVTRAGRQSGADMTIDQVATLTQLAVKIVILGDTDKLSIIISTHCLLLFWFAMGLFVLGYEAIISSFKILNIDNKGFMTLCLHGAET